MSNKLLAALSLVAVIAVTIPFFARTQNISASAARAVAPVEPRRVEETSAASNEDEPQVVSLEVTPSGFEPTETIAHSGTFLILLQNRTGTRDLSFYLVRENQERLAESNPEKRDWKVQVELNPGTYIIGETNHPEWQFTLRVTN